MLICTNFDEILHLCQQVQRVMSMHNNFSSTLPFIPSSTSILTAPHQLPDHRSRESQGNFQSQGNFYPGINPGTFHSRGHQPPPPLSTARPPGRQWPSLSAPRRSMSRGLNEPGTNGIDPGGQLVSVPIRHWWMAVYHHHGDQHSSMRVKRLLLESPESRSTFHQCLQVNRKRKSVPILGTDFRAFLAML